jgi:hypothetical protein
MATRAETIPTEYPIRVAVVFEKGRIRPVWFEVGSTRIRIQEVCYVWKHHEGVAFIVSFAVWDGQSTYELHYNTLSRVWRLGVVEHSSDPSSGVP